MFGMNPGSLEFVFALCAGIGTLFFIIRFFFGFADNFGIDMDVDDGGFDAHDGLDFKFLSVNTVCGFLMMFGWSGLTARLQFHQDEVTSVLIAVLAGLAMGGLLAVLMRAALNLQDTGAVFKIEDSIGKRGKVYQRIPADGKGVIHVSVTSGTHQLDAISEGDDEINSFETVVVLSVQNESTVIVRKV